VIETFFSNGFICGLFADFLFKNWNFDLTMFFFLCKFFVFRLSKLRNDPDYIKYYLFITRYLHVARYLHVTRYLHVARLARYLHVVNLILFPEGFFVNKLFPVYTFSSLRNQL
jgi:hypothetical protein